MDKIDSIGLRDPTASDDARIAILTVERLKGLAAHRDRIGKRILRKAIVQVHAWSGYDRPSS